MIALYARVSTDAQVDTGLVSQLAEVRRYAKEKYSDEAALEFVDDGYSGSILERPSLDALREQIRAGRIRVIVAYNPDRLSRELINTLILMKECERAGVALDFVRGGRFEQTDSGQLLLHQQGPGIPKTSEKVMLRLQNINSIPSEIRRVSS
jgi:site-specific DNA recombinase